MSTNTLLEYNSAHKRASTRRGTGQNPATILPAPPEGVRYHLESGICRGIWIDGIYVRIQGDGRMILESI